MLRIFYFLEKVLTLVLSFLFSERWTQPLYRCRWLYKCLFVKPITHQFSCESLLRKWLSQETFRCVIGFSDCLNKRSQRRPKGRRSIRKNYANPEGFYGVYALLGLETFFRVNSELYWPQLTRMRFGDLAQCLVFFRIPDTVFDSLT